MKRDLYAEVSTRIVAELERGPAPWIKPWSATAGQNVPHNAVTNRPDPGCYVILFWLARNRGWPRPRSHFKQARGWRKRAQGRAWDQGLFCQTAADQGQRRRRNRHSPGPDDARIYGFERRSMRDLPDSVKAGNPMRVRIPIRAMHWPMNFGFSRGRYSGRTRPGRLRAEP